MTAQNLDKPQPRTLWRAWARAAGVWVFPPVYLYLAAHVLFSDKSTPIWDCEQQQMPYYALLADSTHSFSPVLWNPYGSGGAPDYAVSDFFLLSPTAAAVAFVFGGGIHGFKIYWFLMWVFSAWGIVVLGRHFKAPDWGICVVNAGFIFCGFSCGQAQNPTSLTALFYLPWIVWRLDVALQERRIIPALEAGALWGASALCSYIGLTALTGCYCGLWAAGRVLCSETPHAASALTLSRKPAFACAALAVFGVSGLIIMSPVLVGMLVEIKGYSDRAGVLPRPIAISENVIDPGSLFSFASPYVSMIKRHHDSVWPNTNLCLLSIYCGASATALAFAALFTAGRSPWRWWVFALGALCLVAALGYHAPLRGWLYDYFLPFRYFRHPALFRIYWIFTVAVLALYAVRDFEALRAADAARDYRILLIASIVLGATGIVWMYIFKLAAFGLEPMGPLSLLADIHVFGIWGALVAICWFRYKRPEAFRSRIFPAALVALACLDGYLAFQLNRPIMCNELPRDLQFWSGIEAQHRASLDLGADGFNREARSEAVYPSSTAGQLHNTSLITKRPVLLNYSPLTNAFHIAWTATPVLTQSALGFDRIWFAPDAPQIPPTKANFEAYKKRAEEINAAPLVRHAREALLTSSDTADNTVSPEIVKLLAPLNVSPKIIAYLPNRLKFQIETPQAGWLLVTERWARGWQVEINGQQGEVEPGNFIFRCIKVPAGSSTIDFKYHPFGLPALLYLSYGMLALAAALSLWGIVLFRHNSKRNPTTPPSRGEASLPSHAAE